MKKLDFDKEVEKYLRQSKEGFYKNPNSSNKKENTRLNTQEIVVEDGGQLDSNKPLRFEPIEPKNLDKEKNMLIDDDDEDFVNYQNKKKSKQEIDFIEEESDQGELPEEEEENEEDLDDELDDLLRKSFIDLNQVKNEIR